jgi:hypothetical protein
VGLVVFYLSLQHILLQQIEIRKVSQRWYFVKLSSEELLIQIRNQITAYQLNVKSDNKAHRYNINDRAESFTIPLFKLVFGWDKLADLNKNGLQFPGIDLGDDHNQVAVQVTSETSIEKVKDTLKQFIANELYNRFSRIVIFMIQEKQSSYNQITLSKICGKKLVFKCDTDIIDLNGLMQFIKSLAERDLEDILKLFQTETGYIENSPPLEVARSQESHFSASDKPPFEAGLLNLVEVGFPNTLYLADWNFTKKELGSRLRNDRKLVQEALEQRGLKFAADWITTEKQIITFHDLRDNKNALSKIIDQGTVTELDSQEFYENPFYQRKFVELLQKCLQQKLFKLGIHWQKEEKEYIFVPLDAKDKVRVIEWKDKKTDTRTVYRQIPDLKDNTKTYCHEHFAFSARFYLLDSIWYLSITPDWFYSSDGYTRAWYTIEEKRKYKKGVETNQSVSTHLRFIFSFSSLNNPTNQQQLELLVGAGPIVYPYSFLWLKDLAVITHMPLLPDSDWIPLVTSKSDDSVTLL